MITNRLVKMAESKRSAERMEIMEELDDLVWHLYNSLKASQQKLDSIRKVINN